MAIREQYGGMLMGVFSRARRMLQLNKDQKQELLAAMFIVAGESTVPKAYQTALDIRSVVTIEGWDTDEAKDRIAHALSLVKINAVPAIYENACEVGRAIAKGEI